MCDCANRTFFALRCYQSKLSPAIIKVFARLFQKAAGSRASRPCRAPQSAKSYFGVFFLIAFSFAPVCAKEKADGEFDFSFGY